LILESTMKFSSIVCLLGGATKVAAFAFAPAPTQRQCNSFLHAASVGEGLVTNERRAFLLSTFAASLALALPAPANAGGVDYKAVSADIAALIKEDPDKGPTLVRLAWHSSGTYDKMSKTGGSGGGTLRFKEELAHGGNAGLAVTAVKWMDPIHAKYADAGLSYADLYTLGGGMCLCYFFIWFAD
jgi:hypothetical protein